MTEALKVFISFLLLLSYSKIIEGQGLSESNVTNEDSFFKFLHKLEQMKNQSEMEKVSLIAAITITQSLT